MIAPDLDSAIARLQQLVHVAGSIVPFTGAGISTECGIPDFRSPGGLWTKNRPIPFDEFISSQEARNESWRRRILPAQDPVAAIAPSPVFIARARFLPWSPKISTTSTKPQEFRQKISSSCTAIRPSQPASTAINGTSCDGCANAWQRVMAARPTVQTAAVTSRPRPSHSAKPCRMRQYGARRILRNLAIF
jgi:hypothetical protein